MQGQPLHRSRSSNVISETGRRLLIEDSIAVPSLRRRRQANFFRHQFQANLSSIDKPLEDKDTTLHLSCFYGKLSCVELLLDREPLRRSRMKTTLFPWMMRVQEPLFSACTCRRRRHPCPIHLSFVLAVAGPRRRSLLAVPRPRPQALSSLVAVPRRRQARSSSSSSSSVV